MEKIDWIQKSLDCVNGDGYLEKLVDIYPINKNDFRDIDETLIKSIIQNFNNRDPIGLVKSCLYLEKFPINNPYISILRNNEIFNKNIEVVKTIGDILLNMSFDELETLIKAPKSGSRQLGNSFRSWLKNKYENNFLSFDKFENYRGNDIRFLDGGDNTLKQYIDRNFGINTEKGLDLVFKKNRKTYFGEAKFITDSGGGQTNQLNIALDIARMDSNTIGTIAIIDGIAWVDNSYLKKIKEQAVNKNVLTALLLPEYISNL